MRRIHIVFIVFLFASSIGYGQYWGERVAEKSFEEADFFFQPAFLNPYGIGGFGSAVLGLIDDPLINMQLNPALLSSAALPKHHIYINFRNDVNIQKRDEYNVYPLYDYRAGYSSDRYSSWYPQYFSMTTRKATEPIFAGAYILRPFSGRSNYTLGITYQAILQDERYYEIPQGIYRSQLGVDYSGRSVADEKSIPVIDKYRGEDQMHQQGHFLSLFHSATLLPYLDIGLRLSRVTFNRDGSFGSTNLWENTTYYYYSSDRDYIKNRSQDYSHWDISGGMMVRPSKELNVGLSLGVVDGKVTQSLSEYDMSNYYYGNRNKDQNWGIYDRVFNEDQRWEHKGQTVYGGVNLSAQLRPSLRLSLFYRTARQDIDIQLASTLFDTSFSKYRNQWQDSYSGLYIYESESNFRLKDTRHGWGDQTTDMNQVAAALHWLVDDKTRLDFGIQWSEKNRKTSSWEQVFADRFNLYWWTNNGQEQRYYDAVYEDKNLHWRFTTSTTMLQIPIFLSRQLSDHFELEFGINRKMTHWIIEDVTEASYNLKVETVNGETKTRGAVIERYTEPKEIRSDIETVILGGLIIKPAKMFNVRLLAVPTYIKTYNGTELDELQWWIDFNMFL